MNHSSSCFIAAQSQCEHCALTGPASAPRWRNPPFPNAVCPAGALDTTALVASQGQCPCWCSPPPQQVGLACKPNSGSAFLAGIKRARQIQ